MTTPQAQPHTSTEREAFEAWVKDEQETARSRLPGDDWVSGPEYMWPAFQAGFLAAQAAPAISDRNDPVSALAIRLLVAAGHITQEKANEAFSIACNCLEKEAARMNVELPWVTRTAKAAPSQIPAEIATVIQNLHTQDNRITESPLFAVQQKRRVYGLDPDYADHCEWVVDGETWKPENEGEERPEHARRLGYSDHWEFVTGCLTEAGCKAFIACNGHNLNSPRIYAYGSYRNSEWIALRKWLMSLLDAPQPPKEQP